MHRLGGITHFLLIAGLGLGAPAQRTAPTGKAAEPETDKNPRFTVDAMAAKIDGQVVTASDARFFLGISRFLEGSDPLAPEAPGELKGALQRLLLEEMVHSELKALKFDGGPRSAAEQRLADRKKPARAKQWSALLKAYGKTEPQAVDTVWKSLQVERFLQKRVETLTPFVSSSEADDYARRKTPDRPLDEKELARMRPAAMAELKKDKMRKELEDWVLLLKRKYSVINYLDG